MNYCIKMIFLIGILKSSAIFAHNPLHSVYATFFGSEPASAAYQLLVMQAAQAYGYADTMIIPVKKMNSFAQRLIGAHLYSFTLFGIWLNEEFLNNCEEGLCTWFIYHEVAHYLKGHHARGIGLAALMIPSVEYTYLLASWYSGRVIGLATTGLYAYGLWNYAVKPFVKQQEKEADLEAVRVLCKQEKHFIVEAILNFLQECVCYERDADEWHHSFTEQYTYIMDAYQFYCATY